MPGRIRCATCHVEVPWEGNPFRPFCSDRCRILDLGAWVSEGYRIPGEEVDTPSGEETAPAKTANGKLDVDDL